MNTAIPGHRGRDGRGQRPPHAESTNAILHETVPPPNLRRVERFESLEEIEPEFLLAAAPSARASHRIVAVLGALVVMCLVMAAIVWWRLLV